MKNTPLTDKHLALGARMAEFAGYNMPISYSSILEEHLCVRNGVGVFDVSHMGEFIARGKEALPFLQKVTSNDASRLQVGDAQYSCLPNHEGGIVDDLLVYHLPDVEGEQVFLLVVNASNMQKDWNWLSQENRFDARLTDISEETGLLAVQGPKAAAVLQPLTPIDLSVMKYYSFGKGQFAGKDNVLVSATGYTGAGGFEIYARNEDLPEIWDAIFEAGKKEGILPIGLGARDTLRLEMGFALYGNDIDDTTSPLEAGLGWITRLEKGPFNSSELLLKQKQEGLRRKLVGFAMNERRVPRHGYPIVNEAGENIGEVTSGTHSPSLDKPIGMGYVQSACTRPGSEIFVAFGKKSLPAQVVKLPFFRKEEQD